MKKRRILWNRVLIVIIAIIIIAVLLKIKVEISIKKSYSIDITQYNGYNEITEKELIDMRTKHDTYRITYYYSGDDMNSTSCTGSGLCINDFQVNDKGWYTYQGKLVIAAGTTYLLNYNFPYTEGRKYFRYYDEITLTVDGIEYQGIILDSCGASMTSSNNIIDLFVSDNLYGISEYNSIVSWYEK